MIGCKSVHSGAVVPAVIIYGANASGKTNLLSAASTMRRLVMWSQTKGEPGRGVPRNKCLLSPDWSEKPSCFEIGFALDGTRYHYGFEAVDDRFTSEWLYEVPKSHRRRLFEREEQTFVFGRSLKGQNTSIAKLTRTNSLFLSAAAQNGHEQLSRLYKYFQDVQFCYSGSARGMEISSLYRNTGLDSRVIDFLKSIDTGVTGYRERQMEISEESRSLHREIQAVIEKVVGNPVEITDSEEKLYKIELSHLGKHGEEVFLDMDLESDGTRRLLVILGPVLKALDKGLPIFIDELDSSLHTHASEAILKLFCSPQVNRSGAQLIATTHDTNLMKSEILRRDQLWFAEKNFEGATEIYPLTDIRTRKDENIQSGYLQGRYGAVPSNDPVAVLLESL